MKSKAWASLITILLSLLIGCFAYAQSERQLTMTLLPSQESGASKEANNREKLLWIQNSPAQVVFLQFDLSALPAGLKETDFVRCTLRLVAQNVTYEPATNPNSGGVLVVVKGKMANDDLTSLPNTPEVVSLATLSNTAAKKNTVALQETDALTKVVYQEYAGDKKITLEIHTDSHKASSLFYASANSGTPVNPSNIPRLVIEYKQGPPTLLETASWTQHQQNPEHTGRNPWIPFQAPTSFTLVPIPLPQIEGRPPSVADYPLIYQGNLYLISKVLDQNYVLSLNFKGTERWRQAIGKGTVQRSPVISREGILYVVTDTHITGYDLQQSGKVFASYALTGKLSAYTDLTIGNDGSLFLALTENEVHYACGFTPNLKPFFKFGSLGKGQEKISTITVSPDGRTVFAQTPAGAVAIDITNPSEQRTIPLKNNQDTPREYVHVPLAGPAGGVMIFSDFAGKANAGNMWGYTASQRIWNTAGTLMPQPALGSNGRVYYIEGGVLRGHTYDQVGSADITSDVNDPKLKTTSNLVMDGANNIYFWDNGKLHGYSPDGKPLFAVIPTASEVKERSAEGPEQFIRLMMGPEGTLWANNRNGNALFAFHPSYTSADVTVQQKDIKTQTAYRATGKLSVSGVTVAGGTQLVFQARNSIGFATGFKVQKGASLLARTGF